MKFISNCFLIALLLHSRQAGGPKACEEIKGNFQDIVCPQSEEQQWLKTANEKWHFLPLHPSRPIQSKPFTLMARDVSDPKVKEETYRGIEIMKTFKEKKFIPMIVKTIEIDGWVYFLTDSVALSARPAENWSPNFEVLSSSRLKNIFASLLSGLKVVHGAGYVYNNIFSYNQFIAENDNQYPTKLIDFSLAAKIGDPVDDRGDFRYWEPTRLAGQEKTFTPNADFYSLGIMLYQIVHDGKYPFKGETKEEYAKNVLTGKYHISADVLPEIAVMIGMMLQKDANRRLSFEDFAVAVDGFEHQTEIRNLKSDIALYNDKDLPKELLDQLNPGLKSIMFPHNPLTFQSKNDKVEPISKEKTSNKSLFIIYLVGATGILLAIGFIVWVVKFYGAGEPDQKETNSKDDKTIEQPLDGGQAETKVAMS